MKVAIIHLTMTIHCGMRGKTTTTSHPRLVQRGVDRATPTMRHGSRALLLLRLFPPTIPRHLAAARHRLGRPCGSRPSSRSSIGRRVEFPIGGGAAGRDPCVALLVSGGGTPMSRILWFDGEGSVS